MKIIIDVNGKIFYSERAFKKYIIKNNLIGQKFLCKYGLYWRRAVVVPANKIKRPTYQRYTEQGRYDVLYM